MWKIFASAAIAAACIAAPAAAQHTASGRGTQPIARTPDGALRGISREGVDAYLGVPYAAPPVGELRWQPPVQPAKWRGVRNATRKAASCAQVTTLGVFAGPTSVEEDCLYLNVYAAKKGVKKPVIVWIHGGAFLDGSGNDYEGWKLASGGPDGVPSVVVSINYRLGLFGVLAHAGLDGEGHPAGNYAILDQQEALRWVKRNIAAFGGDPDNVTLAGESAGSSAVMANMLSPLARGLFHRAIIMSTPGFTAWLPPTELSKNMGRNFAVAAGCPGEDAAAAKCLRRLSATRILQLQGTIANGGPYNTGFPYVDGTVIPMAPEQAWTSGNFIKVPVLSGGVRNEAMFFYAGSLYFNTATVSRTGLSVPKTPEDYAVATSPGAFCIWCNAERKMPPGVAEAYPLSDFKGDAMHALARVGSDGARCRELHVHNRLIEAGVPVYAYEFAYEDAPFYFPRFAGYKPGAAHTIDIQFVFDDFHGGHLGVNLDQVTGQPRGLNAAEARLSDLMVAHWTRFAQAGTPNRPGTNEWPRLAKDSAGQYFVQDLAPSLKSVKDFRQDHRCDFFDPQLKY